MKIKRLEIKGFKSFPDKTVLEFKPGITAVVGPNGCGKSNVLESIRWVMGEQRARILRGKKMEDVIFNGSETRKPVGMAEVQLVLSNTDGFGPVSMVDYDEIMIARRLFRDGDSQYELNNVPCRLSDVVDFFLDTGVGKNSYAIIEQGRVDMVVASKPEDRRVLIEEAAGINRYKSRKEAAIKKLEQTQQNLLRISDVISEVKRQSTALKRQASRAERYRKLTDQLRESDLAIHSWRCAELNGEIMRTQGFFEQERLQLSGSEASYSELSALLESERLEALETDGRLKESLEARHQVDVELTAVRGLAEKNKAGISQLSERRKRSAEELKALQEKLAEAGLRKDSLEKNRKDLSEETESASAELKQAFTEMRAADQGLNEERKRSERLKEDVFRALQESAQERNRLSSLAKRGKEIEVGLLKLQSEEESVASSLQKDKLENVQLGHSIQEAANQRAEEIRRKEKLSASRDELRRRIASMRESIVVTERQLAGAKARLGSLTEMQQDYRGYDEGVRFLMKTEDARSDGDLLGPLAEMIDVAPEFQRALTAALGERLGYLVVKSTRAAVDAANLLKESGAGRSGFLPLSPKLEGKADCCSRPENVPCMRELVNVRDWCADLAGFLLNRSFLVDDVETAIQLWGREGLFVDLVTRSGEILTRHGEFIGGTEDSRRDEIFDKRREIEDLQKSVLKMGESLDRLRASFDTAESEEKNLSTDLDLCRTTVNELSLKESSFRKDKERLESAIEGHKRRQSVLSLEIEALTKERQGLEDQFKNTEAKASDIESRRLDLERQKEEASRKAEELHAVAREKSRSTGELRVRLAQFEERKRSLDREFQSLTETLQQYAARVSGLTRDISHATEDEKTLSEELQISLAREQELL
ncbi:MAG: chromosome segregation protein SMC, partial [Desulfomonile tiedjei]|nr:chromosome segregation protein SMC [Desulfomonile tiedjei]